jgi:flagellum-specific peptidoglycan hydrolase FlgJ
MVEARYKVPSAVTLAQWALESRWGKNNLGVSNYFGHTYAATKTFIASPKFVVFHELINASGTSRPGRLVKFASYRSITECFDAHGQYLSTSQLYRDAFFATNAEQFAKIISLHYATDPDYATKLITIIRRYKLS